MTFIQIWTKSEGIIQTFGEHANVTEVQGCTRFLTIKHNN